MKHQFAAVAGNTRGPFHALAQVIVAQNAKFYVHAREFMKTKPSLHVGEPPHAVLINKDSDSSSEG